jgi:hypothetical protein
MDPKIAAAIAAIGRSLDGDQVPACNLG